MRKIFTLLLSLLLLPLMAWGQEEINLSQGDQTLQSGTYIISNYNGQNRIIIAQDAEVTITLENVTIRANANVSPFDASQAQNVVLLLKGSNSLTATNQAPGLYTPVGGSITIRDAEGDDTVGSLSVEGAMYWPGIGIKDGENTNITIESGAITAQGGPGAAGIGGSSGASGFTNGTVTISGGTVTAIGKNGGAGIGGGWGSFASGGGGTVVISGGIVTATGEYGGAGIGGQNPSFSTGTNGNAIIMASSIGDKSKQGEWDGIFFIGNENSGTVYGDVTLQEDWTIDNGQTLEIPDGSTLTIPDDVTLTNNGTISGDGAIIGNIPSGWSGDVAYKLTYDLNGGTGTAPEGGYVIAGETVTLPETTSYTKEGYTCIGWAESKDATEALTSYTMPNNAVTLYAVWAKDATDVSREITGKVGEAFTELDLTSLITDKELGEYTLTLKDNNTLPEGLTLSADYKLSAGNSLVQAVSNYNVLYTIAPKSGAKEATLTLTFNIEKGDATITWNDALGPFTYNGKAVEITPPNVTGTPDFSIAATLSYAKTSEGGDTELAEAPTGAGSYKVTASFAGNDNYNAATDVTKEFTIAKATPTFADNWAIEENKVYDGNAITITSPTLNGVGEETITEGITLQYKMEGQADDAYTETVPTNAGTYTVKASFAGNANYNTADDVTKEFTIAKAMPTYTVPTGLTATYGQTLADVSLPEGWSWQDEGTTSVGNVGSNTFKATFTSTDTHNYNTVPDIDVTITVAQAEPDDYIVPTGLTATYGQTLADVALPEVENGVWSWKDETTSVGEAGERTFTAIFTPTDPNYGSVEAQVTITVSQAALPIGSEVTLDKASETIEYTGVETTTTLIATVTGNLGENPKWEWKSNDELVATVMENTDNTSSIQTRATETRQSEAIITIHKTGEAEITAIYTDSKYTGEVTFNLTVTEKEEEPDPAPDPKPDPKPDPTPTYYNIQFEDICEGVDASLSKSVVKEGNQVSVYVEVEEGYDAENLKVSFKRSLYGYWEEVEEGVQPGEYIIYNVYADIYVKVEGVEKIEEEPTGMSDIEGMKVYAETGH